MFKRLVFKTVNVIARMRDPYYQGTAAEVAFYLLFSVLPIMLILSTVLRFFEISPDILTNIVNEYFDSQYTSTIVAYISAGPSTEVTFVFLIVALWAASKGQFSLIRIANYSYRLDGRERAGYIRSRIRAILTEVIFIALIVASLILLVFGEMIFNFMQTVLLEYFKINIEIGRVWLVLRWPVAFCAYIACMAINYSVLPNRRIPIKRTIPGALFASVVMLVATWGYSVYLNYFSNFSALYGSLASIIALLFWFYILSYIIVIGILINVIWFEPL